MKYVLGIGYDCKKYKQDPRCRVFVNNQLIDEFYIATPKNKGVNKWKKYKSHQTYIPYLWKKIHFYHIDENVFTKDINDIRIEIQNAVSNYTNGFMTRSTLLDLRHIFLLPKNFLKYFKTDAENFYKHIGQIIPKKYNGVGNVFTNHGTTNTTIEARLKGYPFPFRYNWQGKNMIPSSVGGSGSLILELGSTNKIITFKPFDDILDFDMNTAFPEDEKNTNKFLWNEDYNTKMAMRMKGLPDKEADYILNNTAIPAFPFSEQFFALAGEVLKDKYNI